MVEVGRQNPDALLRLRQRWDSRRGGRHRQPLNCLGNQLVHWAPTGGEGGVRSDSLQSQSSNRRASGSATCERFRLPDSLELEVFIAERHSCGAEMRLAQAVDVARRPSTVAEHLVVRDGGLRDAGILHECPRWQHAPLVFDADRTSA